MGRGKKNGLQKAEAALNGPVETMDHAAGETQWWMPVDLEERSKALAKQMVDALEPKLAERLLYMDKNRMGKRMKLELNAQLLLSAAESAEFRVELAKWMLMKPLEVMKLANGLQQKSVQIDQEVRVQHAIVVPAEQSIEEWTAKHQQDALSMKEEWELGAGEFVIEANRVEIPNDREP